MVRNRLRILKKMSLDDYKVRILIPRKNLNSPEPNKGWTQLLLRHAGWELEGYEPGKEAEHPRILKGDPEVEFICMRPRLMPLYLTQEKFLGKENADLAIYGRDTHEEWFSTFARNFLVDFKEKEWTKRTKETIKIIRNCPSLGLPEKPIKYPRKAIKRSKEYSTLLSFLSREHKKSINRESYILPNEICDLGFGKVDLCFAAKEPLPEWFSDVGSLVAYFSDNPWGISCVTEYPNLAFRELTRYFPPNMFEIKNIPVDFLFSKSLLLPDKMQKLIRHARSGRIYIVHLPATELAIWYDIGDMNLECVASGRSLKEAGMEKIGKPILTSTARLYTRPLSLTAEDQQHMGVKVDKEDIDLERWKQKKIEELILIFQEAARGYGKYGESYAGRKDSIYYEKGQLMLFD